MKLLIISNCNNSDPQNLKDCKSRIELLIFIIKKYLNNVKDIEIIIDKCYPYLEMKKCHTNLSVNNFPIVDHTLFIDDTGFYKKNDSLYDHIRKITRYSISTICDSNKYNTREDIIFAFDKNINNKKLCSIMPLLDEHIYIPKKDKKIVYILLNKSYDDTLKNIRKYIDKTGKNIKIGLIDQYSVDFIDNKNNITKTKHFSHYTDFIDEISRANIFFITSKIINNYLLYELAICNTFIVTNNIHIDKNIINELNIYIYNDMIDLNDIFIHMKSYNIRASLIKKCSCDNNLKIIIENLKNNKMMTSAKEINLNENKSKSNNIIKYLNITNKDKPYVVEIISHNDENKVNKVNTKRNNIFLQSQLLTL